jgi:hypothetical protein
VLPAGDPAAWTRAFAQALADPAELVRQAERIPARTAGTDSLDAVEALCRACATRALDGAA